MQFVINRLGNKQLMLDGYKYKFNRKTKDYILWLCNREKLYKCKARAKTDPEYKRLLEIIGDHKGHPPNKQTGKELEVGRSTFSVVVKPEQSNFHKGIQQVQFFTAKDGRKVLVIDGYTFDFSARIKDHHVDWYCSFSDSLNCSAHARTDINYSTVLQYNNEHCHEPDHDPLK